MLDFRIVHGAREHAPRVTVRRQLIRQGINDLLTRLVSREGTNKPKVQFVERRLKSACSSGPLCFLRRPWASGGAEGASATDLKLYLLLKLSVVANRLLSY